MSSNSDPFFVSTENEKNEDIDRFFVEPKEQGGLLGTPRQLGVYTQEALSQIGGGIGDVQRFVNDLIASGFSKIGAEKFAEQYRQSGLNFPTSEQIRDKMNEVFQAKFAPESEEEKLRAEKIGMGVSLATPSIFGRLPALRSAVAAGSSYLGEKGSEILGLPKEQQKMVGNITGILPLIAKGQIRPTEKEAEELYETGKKIGLTEEQLTPLLNLRTKKVVEGTKLHDLLTDTKSILGKSYDDLKNLPSMNKNLPLKNRVNLIKELDGIKTEISHIPAPTPEQKAAISYIDEAINGIKNNKGTTGKGLINLWQGINKEFGGTTGTRLEGLKNSIGNAIHSSDPQAFKEYKHINDLYERMKSFRQIGQDKIDKFVKSGGKVAGAVIGFHVGHIPGALLGLASEKAVEKISEKLLLDPNWQNITKTSLKALVNNSPKIAQMAITQLENKVKEEMPDEYKEIDWEKLK